MSIILTNNILKLPNELQLHIYSLYYDINKIILNKIIKFHNYYVYKELTKYFSHTNLKTEIYRCLCYNKELYYKINKKIKIDFDNINNFNPETLFKKINYFETNFIYNYICFYS